MNPGQVFDRERIYEKVCGYDAEGDSRVVTELIRRVRKKLAEYTQTEYIETVWGMGYRWKDKKFILEKTMVLYTILSLIVTFFLSVSIIEIAGQIQEEVWWKYVDQDEYDQAMNDRNENFEVVVPRPNQSKMSRMDWHISETCDFLQTYGVLLFLLPDVELRSACFTNKLKRPIQELKMASQMIAEEDLDFHMAYENEDEMGMLCREFERMRGQLEENNRRLWQMIEDERVLRAAIAHDIRSPLAIMRGYQEMLLEFVPEDMLDQEK